MKLELTPVKGVLFSALNAGIKNAQNSTANSNQNATSKLDLALVLLPEGSITAAVFTQNIFCAAPVLVAKNHLNHSVRALIINSGNANAGTGVATGSVGLNNAYEICEMVASAVQVEAKEVLPFSTGVIGQPLPMVCFKENISILGSQLSTTQFPQVAQAILTTDLIEKKATVEFEVQGKTITLSGIAKGSGMIRPNMATMLSFIFTDICADQNLLQTCLQHAVNTSFNRITVDGDTSTNDACTLSATGASGVLLKDCLKQFQQALNQLTQSLAHQIIRDGEGATKFVEVCVEGGETQADCLEVAYTVAHSLLVKTALFASDANWGRILAAVGRAPVRGLSVKMVSIYLNELCLIKQGELDKNYTEALGGEQMAKSDIVLTIKIGKQTTQERVWTTDLSYDYVKINAEYRS
jgi:glutamate N-acetyltransferase/amino-acid N-acetyltransferase